MPVQIEELVVKAHVLDNKNKSAEAEEKGKEETCPDETSLKPIENAVKEIMDILKRKNER